MCFTQRTTKHSKVLRKHINKAAINSAEPSYHTIAQIFFSVQSEFNRAMRNKHTYLFKAAFIHQKMNALTGGELAFFMLRLNALFASAQLGLSNLFIQNLKLV